MAITKKLKPAKIRSLAKEKVWIDTNIVSTACKHLHNHVEYFLFKSDEDPSVIPEGLVEKNKKSMIRHVCFSGLSSRVTKEKANRLYFKLEIDEPRKISPGSDRILSPSDRIEWMALAKEYKMLPAYINVEAIKDIPEEERVASYTSYDTDNPRRVMSTGEFIIDLEGLSPTVLYIYLSTIRNLREDPGLAKSVLYLTKEVGMNFFAAYVFASGVVLDSYGHHIFEHIRKYGMCKDIYDKKLHCYTSTSLSLGDIEKAIETPIHLAIGTQRVVNSSPSKYDSREVMNLQGNHRFNCASTITGVSKVRYSANFQELFDEDIISAIMSKTDREANKFLKEFFKRKPHIKYKEAEN